MPSNRFTNEVVGAIDVVSVRDSLLSDRRADRLDGFAAIAGFCMELTSGDAICLDSVLPASVFVVVACAVAAKAAAWEGEVDLDGVFAKGADRVLPNRTLSCLPFMLCVAVRPSVLEAVIRRPCARPALTAADTASLLCVSLDFEDRGVRAVWCVPREGRSRAS